MDKDEDTSQEILTCGYIEEYVQAGYDQTNNFDKCYDFAESGNKDAQFYIGYFYNNGLVVNKNFSTAAYWYRKAIDNGDIDSNYYLAKIIIDGFIEVENNDLIKMLDLSFNSYFKNESIFLKSKVYKYGIGTENNYEKY